MSLSAASGALVATWDKEKNTLLERGNAGPIGRDNLTHSHLRDQKQYCSGLLRYGVFHEMFDR